MKVNLGKDLVENGIIRKTQNKLCLFCGKKKPKSFTIPKHSESLLKKLMEFTTTVTYCDSCCDKAWSKYGNPIGGLVHDPVVMMVYKELEL